jgi:hypothetical protein
MISTFRLKCTVVVAALFALLLTLTDARSHDTHQSSQTLTVCLVPVCAYPSIQEAVDAAKPGDTVLVYPPFFSAPIVVSYYENISITKPLRVIAASRGEVGATVIAPRNADLPAVTIAAERQEVLLTGFTIAVANQEVGVLLHEGSQARLEGIFFDQQRKGTPTGIRVQRRAQVSITQSLFSFTSSGIAIESGSGLVSIRENVFVLPTQAIIVKGQAEIIGNQISAGLIGVEIESSQRVVVQKNVITGYGNSGVHVSKGLVQIRDNVLAGRGGFPANDGILVSGPSEVEISHNVIVGHVVGVLIAQAPCVSQAEPVETKITGADNLIANFTEAALCPANYPWPPGFVKP